MWQRSSYFATSIGAAFLVLAPIAGAQFSDKAPADKQPGWLSDRPGAPDPLKKELFPAIRSLGVQPVLVDRIVAVVNNEVITSQQLEERIAVVLRQVQRQPNATIPPREALQKQVLDRMITDRALLQYARDTGIQVEERAIDTAIRRIADQNKISPAEFRTLLERDGISYDKFRQDIREELMLARLRERDVDNRIQISESEIDNFLADTSSSGGANRGMEYNFSHVLVRVADRAAPNQVNERLNRAQEAQQRARGGENFADIAAKYSDAPDNVKGGDMGWRPHDRLPEAFAAALAKMQPGEVSEILRSPAGFHIIKLRDKRGGTGPVSVEQTRVRHILVRTNELVSEAEARRKLTLLRERVIQGADFAELARLNSDDGSAGRGGELGWVHQGDLVPDFERVMNSLKLNEVSEPVKTPFGLHIIQVLDRRIGDVGGDRKRMEARKVLRERRAEEAYAEWMRSIRDRSFVEYRLDDK
jgi:peptidyl-prolyl cis-trans isomerase SurA